jgi:hypothetical protein
LITLGGSILILDGSLTLMQFNPITVSSQSRLRSTSIVALTNRPNGAGFGLLVLVCFLGTLSMSGCQQLPGGQAMRQYQLESDRLLNEFRAQKKRADDLENRNVQLERRLAESEKMLALGSSGNRSKGRSSELLLGDSNRSGISLSDRDSSRSSVSRNGTSQNAMSQNPSFQNPSSRSSTSNRTGLADASPSTAGRLTSGLSRDPISLGGNDRDRDLRGDSSRESQWRPIGNPGR